MIRQIVHYGIHEMNEFYRVAEGDKAIIIEFAKLRNSLMARDGITWDTEQVKFVNAYYRKINYTGQ